ncbi:MAG: hypothetical protein RIT25_1540 [Planctomycetota bacterium]
MHACLLLVPLLTAMPQEPGEVLARFVLDGKPAVVSRDDVALEMAFHQRRRDQGKQGAEHLVNSALVRMEAEEKKVMPSPEEVEGWWKAMQEQIRAAGRKPENLPVVRNTPHAELMKDFANQLAHERLVRTELDLRPTEGVSPDLLRLWLKEARDRHTVVDDPEQLPIGAVASIDGREIPMVELGRLLLRTSNNEEREKFTRQVVLLSTLEHMARTQGIEVSKEDLERELDRKRREAEGDPRFGGLGFDQLLKSQGSSPQLLVQSRVFRGQVLQRKLVEKLHPDDKLTAELAANRTALLEQAGPRRHLATIFVRALEEPNALITKDFAAATAQLEKARKRVVDGEEFDTVARIETEDTGGKVRGGDRGLCFRRQPGLPEEVLAAAFGMEEGELSQPIRAAEGVHLVKVLAIEPVPSDAVVMARLREQRIDDLTRTIFETAKLEITGTEPNKQPR